MASVGPPKIPKSRTDGDGYHPNDPDHANDIGRQTLNEVIIGGAKDADDNVVRTIIGDATGVAAGYGGNIFGACRGDLNLDVEDPTSFGTSVWTKVLIKAGANILGNVFGGGDAGMVRRDSDVQVGE